MGLLDKAKSWLNRFIDKTANKAVDKAANKAADKLVSDAEKKIAESNKETSVAMADAQAEQAQALAGSTTVQTGPSVSVDLNRGASKNDVELAKQQAEMMKQQNEMMKNAAAMSAMQGARGGNVDGMSYANEMMNYLEFGPGMKVVGVKDNAPDWIKEAYKNGAFEEK